MREKQPKHRQLAKERTKAERKKAGRRESGSALLVCEGECTEPFYLKGLPETFIEPIVSTPCFEVWLLLHFRYCDQPFGRFADVLPELQVGLPDYSKAAPHIFAKVGGGEGLQRAMLFAQRLRQALAATGANSPATDVDKLVEALRTIAPPG